MKSHKKTILISAQKVTFTITIILLLSFMFADPLTEWIWQAKPPSYTEIPLWYKSCYIFIEYLLLVTVIWLNRNNLSKLNIDKLFIVILIFSGTILSFYYLPYALGTISLLLTWMVLRQLTKNKFKFNDSPLTYSRIGLVFIFGLIPVILFYFLKIFFDPSRGEHNTIMTTLYYANLPQVIIQETVFRGMLWMYLGELGLNESKVFYAQALLFWFSHINYWSNPIMFWIWLPLGSIWLGLLVWRSKSITSSTVGHFIFNFITVLSR